MQAGAGTDHSWRGRPALRYGSREHSVELFTYACFGARDGGNGQHSIWPPRHLLAMGTYWQLAAQHMALYMLYRHGMGSTAYGPLDTDWAWAAQHAKHGSLDTDWLWAAQHGSLDTGYGRHGSL